MMYIALNGRCAPSATYSAIYIQSVLHIIYAHAHSTNQIVTSSQSQKASSCRNMPAPSLWAQSYMNAHTMTGRQPNIVITWSIDEFQPS